MADLRKTPMDGPTFALAVVVVGSLVPTIMLALTGIGFAGACLAIAICRFFGRPHIAFALFAVAVAMLAFSLSRGVGLSVWVIAFQAYWATWLHGTFPIVTVQIWIDPTGIDLDRMTLGATGLIVGGIVELVADGRRNSKIVQLMAAGFRPPTRRAPIAFICAWLASRRPAASRKGSLLGTELVRGSSLYLSESDLNHHCLILGTTGTGKTTTLTNLIEAAAKRRQPTVYLDGKGDEAFADVVRKIAVRFGRPFYIFNALATEQSCAYNPLATGDFTSKADRVMNLREWTEPHHESLASSYLQTSFKILDHVGAVIDIVQASRALTITHLLGLLRRKGFSDPKKQALANEISEQEVAERTSIDSLRSDIRYIANSSLGVLFDTVQAEKDGRPILNLEQARREGAVVYFLMPPLLFQKAAPKISQLIINDLKSVTATSRAPIKMFFDESTFSTQAALNLVNMGRTFGVAATFSTQGLADFHAGAPELGEAFVKQVIASVNVYIIHKLNEPDEAETIARLIGTNTQVELTAQTESEKPTGAASARKVREFLVHPDDLKLIAKGQAYVLNKNKGTVARIAVRKSRI